MTLERNTIIWHLAGGAAHNIAERALKVLLNLPDGFARSKFSFIDTSKNNYNHIEPTGPFYGIVRKATALKNEISGSGGDRISNASDIIANIPDYLESINIKTRKTGEYHIVVSSGSGGSGNIIATAIADSLLDKNIPVIMFIIGDSSDALKLRNTQSTLSTLSKKAVSKGKCLLTYYINNAEMSGNLTSSEEIANKRIKDAAMILTAFLSGQNDDIDQADMNNLINQHDYKGLDIPAGIYTLSFHSGNQPIQLPDFAIPTIARTLRTADNEVEFNIPILHHKVGRITCEGAIQLLAPTCPIHIVASNGLLKEEVRKLTEANQASAQRQKDLKNCNIEAAGHTSFDEELGMDF